MFVLLLPRQHNSSTLHAATVLSLPISVTHPVNPVLHPRSGKRALNLNPPAPFKRIHTSPVGSSLNSSSSSPHSSPRKIARLTSPHRETVEDQIHRIISNLESELLQLFQVNFVEDDTDLYRDSYMLKGILDRCAFPSYYISDVHADALEMPQALRHYITGLLGQDPIRPARPDSWTPPPFKAVDHYCYTLCRESRHLINFGVFDFKNLTLSLSASVVCWGDADNDLIGEGVMDLIYAPPCQTSS